MNGDGDRPSDRPPFDREGNPDVERELRHRAKSALRKKLRAIRRAVPAEARATRSKKIAECVRELPDWQSARVIAAYVAMRGEVDPAPLVHTAHQTGKVVAFPRVDWGRDEMTFREVPEGSALEESGMGFEQPPAGCPVVDAASVDLVLVPALAIDERGHRIGWGKGFYDRILPGLINATYVGLVFDFQLLAEVPQTEGDVPVHVVASDRGVIRPVQ